MSTDTQKHEQLMGIGRSVYASIKEMVSALQLDWDRLEELQGERDDWDTEDGKFKAWSEANPISAEELAELEQNAGDCTDQDDARQRIEEDALSVEVRSDWHAPGGDSEPENFVSR